MTETINWDKFDKQVDSEEIKSAVEDAKRMIFLIFLMANMK